jgi:uncharacterized protein GlcG (DUF336 family)
LIESKAARSGRAHDAGEAAAPVAATKKEVLMNSAYRIGLAASLLLAGAAAIAQAVPATHSIRVLTPEAAQKAMNAALADCRKKGYQVAVAVVDRSGVAQAMVRDRFAGAHTVDVATDKAWTAVSFRTDTTELAKATQPGQASSGLRSVARFVAVGGGVTIQAAGSTIGGIGVSGAPSGEADESCAKAGIAAVRDELEM